MEYQKIIKLSKLHHKIIQRLLQMTQRKYISLERRQKKYWYFEMNYNSIIMEYQKIIKLLQNISINQVNLE